MNSNNRQRSLKYGNVRDVSLEMWNSNIEKYKKIVLKKNVESESRSMGALLKFSPCPQLVDADDGD